jgi:hypothetical protein
LDRCKRLLPRQIRKRTSSFNGCKYKDTELNHLDRAHENKATCENAPIPAIDQIPDGGDKIRLLDCGILKRMKEERCTDWGFGWEWDRRSRKGSHQRMSNRRPWASQDSPAAHRLLEILLDSRLASAETGSHHY